MKISFVCAGGTIDKDYPRHAESYCFEVSEPAVKRVLEKVNPAFSYEIFSVLKKDSLDMDDADRAQIFSVCKKIKNDKIIVTHGTDTMRHTAKELDRIKNKSIILVGASKPEKFHDSDAHFNIGVAVGAMSTVKNGVFIAMNGVIHRWNKVKKQKHDGKFVRK